MDEENVKEAQRSSVEGYGSGEVEKELVRCLTGDAQAVARVCTDIVSWTGPVQHPAWENPNKNVNLLNYLPQPSDSDLQYVPALEQTLDILHLYLKLLVSYFNRMPIVMEAFKSSDMAIAAKRVTLPALVWMLWSRVRFVNDELYKGVSHIQPTTAPNKDEKLSQTEVSSLSTCENCSTAQEAITKLVDLMEKICTNLHIKGSQVVEVRKTMADDIFYITQWSAVSKWCDALLSDIDLLGNLSWQATYQSRKAQNKIKQIKEESTEFEERLKLIEDEKAKLKIDIEKAYESKANYIKKSSELTMKLKGKNSQIDDLEKKNSDLENLVNSLKKELSDFKQSFVKEKEKYSDVDNEIKQKLEEIEKMKELLSEEKSAKFSETQREIEVKDKIIADLQDKIDLLQLDLETAAKKEENLNLNILKEQNHGAILWSNYETLKDAIRKQEDLISEKEQNEEHLLDTIVSLKSQLSCSTTTRADIKLTGDPIRDMESQKRENEETIKRLSEHNLQIEKTLTKLYSISDMPEIC